MFFIITFKKRWSNLRTKASDNSLFFQTGPNVLMKANVYELQIRFQ